MGTARARASQYPADPAAHPGVPGPDVRSLGPLPHQRKLSLMKRLLLGSALALALTGIGFRRTGAADEAFKTRLFGAIPNIAVRGIPSAGAPWVAGPSKVALGNDGSLRV